MQQQQSEWYSLREHVLRRPLCRAELFVILVSVEKGRRVAGVGVRITHMNVQSNVRVCRRNVWKYCWLEVMLNRTVRGCRGNY